MTPSELMEYVKKRRQSKVINLAFTEIEGIPKGLFDRSKKLEVVNFEETYTSDIPDGLFDHCPNLKEVYLGGNFIDKLPQGLFDHCPKLTVFEISNADDQGLHNIPIGLFKNCRALRDVYFGGNLMEEIPPDLFINCRELKIFEGVVGRLKSISPLLFSNCPLLEFVTFERNQIESLPKDLFVNCPNLQQVSFASNKLKSVPIELFDNCPKLQEIRFTGNSLSELNLPAFLNQPGINIYIDENVSNLLFHSPGEEMDFGCRNNEDIFTLEDFENGEMEFKAENRVLILDEGDSVKGFCVNQHDIIKMMLMMGGNKGDIPTMGPWPKRTNRYFKLPYTNQWVDFAGFKLILEGYKVLRMQFLRKEKIGSQLGVGTLHGAEENIYTLQKIQRYKDRNFIRLKAMIMDEKLYIEADTKFRDIF